MNFESKAFIPSIETKKQKETTEKQETNQEKRERLVIFEIKRKISPNIVKNKLKELNQLKQELKEMKNLGIEDDFSDKIKKIKELNKWLQKNVIIHHVKNEILYGACVKNITKTQIIHIY